MPERNHIKKNEDRQAKEKLEREHIKKKERQHHAKSELPANQRRHSDPPKQ